MRLRVFTVDRHECMTKDNVKVTLDATVSFRVTNPLVAKYRAGRNLNKAIANLAISSIRSTIGTHTLDQILIERVSVGQEISKHVSKRLLAGFKIETVYLD